MSKMQDVQNVAIFHHNDFLLDYWYDRQIEQADEKEPIEFDYKKGREIFGKSVVDWLNEELKTDLTFIKVIQPKEYNFDSDKIELNYSINDLFRVEQYINIQCLSEDLDRFIYEITTHRSGFIPFYSESQVRENSDLLLGCMLQVIHDELNKDSSLNDYESFYDRKCVYDSLLECVITQEI